MLTALANGAFIGGLHVLIRKRSKRWILVWSALSLIAALPGSILWSAFVDSYHAPMGGFGK